VSAKGTTPGLVDRPVEWACPQTGQRLETRDGILATGAGGPEYEVVDGFPVFACSETEQRRAEQHGPVLDGLLERLWESSSEEAADWFCRRHGCTREPYATDWKYLFAPPARGLVLELGAGFGDDSVTLTRDPSNAVLAVPTLANARIVRRHLDEQAPGPRPIAVLPSVERLPLADDSVGAITLEEAALAGFGISEQNFARVVAEWKRVLTADGVVFLGLGNSLLRLPGLAALRSQFAAPAADSMNRTVKRAQAASGGGLLRIGTAVREMQRQGFGDPSVYAPLPSEKQADVVLPVRDRVAMDYFIDHLVRRNSAITRVAIEVARLALRRGWFQHLLPYHYLFFKLPGAAAGCGREPS
jgi:SAM-dependent methyltransferase